MPKGLRFTFLIHAIVVFLLAIGLLVLPEKVAGEGSDTIVSRFTGASLLAISIGSFLSYAAQNASRVKIYTAVQIFMCIFGLLAALWAIFTGTTSSFVWGNLGFFAVFGILFILFFPREA